MSRLFTVLATSLLLASALGPVAHAGDAPEISRSRGKRDNLVLLWTRVVPDDADPQATSLARGLQDELLSLATTQRPDLHVDVRPAPERVCPREGCKATSVGAVLLHQGAGCAVVAVVGAPEGGVMTLIPWSGTLALKATQLPFRELVENQVTVLDFTPCDVLLDSLEGEGTQAIRGLLGEAVEEAY